MSLLGYTSKEYQDEKGRDYYFDNAKFLLIFFVVLAHAVSPLQYTMPKVMTVWKIINTMHKPCMIFITGYFAKSYIKNGVVNTRRLVTYVVYYLAAQVAVSLFEFFVLGDHNIGKSLFYPRSSLWYLMCMIGWFGILPYIYKIRPKFIIPFSFVFAIVAGYDNKAENFLSIMRMVNHFPFFIIGYYFKKDWLFKFRNKATQICALLIGAGMTVWTFYHLDVIPSKIITCNYSYYDANLKTMTELPVMFVHRVLFYIAAIVLCACFLLLVPRGKAVFTRFGARTLQVYILNRFLYLSETKFKWYEPFLGSAKGAAEMALIALAVTIILSLKPFEYPFKLLEKISLKPLERNSDEQVKV